MTTDKSAEYNIIKRNHEIGKKNLEKNLSTVRLDWHNIDHFAAVVHRVLLEIAWTGMPLLYWVGNEETGEPI